MTPTLWTIVVVILCLAAEGFFSGAEIGLVSADRTKLRHDAAKGSRGAALALKMLERPEWLLSTTLVGTNIAVVTNTTIVTALMIEVFGPQYSWLAVVFVAPLIWIFGEIVPKSVFQQRSNVITPKAIFLLNFCSYLFSPILWVFTLLSRFLSWLVGDRHTANPFTLREEIVSMMQMPAQGGDIQPIEKKMIRRLFDFGETTAGNVMVPLIDVACIEKGARVGVAVKLARRKAHHLLPVYADRVDQIIGQLDCLELLGVDSRKPIKPYIRPVDYVPSARSIQDLLLDMRQEGQVMSVVVDEFGGAEGIVTVEDIMEEVVEDLQDEYDADEVHTQWVRKLGERDFVVSARIELDSLAEELGIRLPHGSYTSLSGFLLEKAADIPPVGAVVEYRGIKFTVEAATPRLIREVRIQW
ncbi:MAG: hemolysin family protein [Hyphomicrobiales bacterium]|nr:hemolysin family protein [Hyphomicrobiales bacterium]